MSTPPVGSALALIDSAIAELEARLSISDGQSQPPSAAKSKQPSAKPKKQPAAPSAAAAVNNDDLPAICKIEFKVGVITRAWVHETADKLYCEEIDCGEPEPRQIASGLRPHFTLEQMQGQRLLVVANLKAKNLVGFKSHGMVLCAARPNENGAPGELVEFVEPPAGAALGEVITFQDLPSPQPATAAQVEKKKLFQACLDGLKTTDDCQAAWNGHVFMTSAGPCTVKSIQGGVMR